MLDVYTNVYLLKCFLLADTMDEVHVLVDEHIRYLQRVQPKARAVARLMKQRKELIQVIIIINSFNFTMSH